MVETGAGDRLAGVAAHAFDPDAGAVAIVFEPSAKSSGVIQSAVTDRVEAFVDSFPTELLQ
ncbi:MAG: hypothetical protein Tsb002_17060 [Wenzhouxiangellaceae bacterium]